MTKTSLSAATMAVVSRYAQRRGISPDNIREYLNPQLNPSRYPLPDAGKTSARLLAAIQNGESIAMFGDYDADGITSVSILLRFFHECTPLRPGWKLPNRQTDHDDLDLVAAEKMLAAFHPTLVICVDNGTNAAEGVSWLRSQGADTIVVDHHPCTTLATVAMVNPKAHPAAAAGDLDDLCAAGFAIGASPRSDPGALVPHPPADDFNVVVVWIDERPATPLAVGDKPRMTRL